MIKTVLPSVIAALLLVCTASAPGFAQEVEVIKFDQLQQLRQQPHDTLYVVNFWATWCKPCIKELPYFEAANVLYKDQPVKVILVSMDAAEDLETRVKPFVQKRGLKADLLLLDEVDGNSWIDKLEPKWSGAIPATLVFNNKRKQYEFVESEMTQEELTKLIEKYKP
ncbi:AhpC/TSA family protein [Pontibacter ummariensis]|uniref:AhpC/TSA family protein n=1 Tax=Pontibacter ummariensis TaxID=1610492 RepID=A0A239L086_9BACT|nr:TlpA disulfide reductase family protein [Pontibacter ummariensis]PRY04621.1 AhpC/TSA family protein [Pontibacter ummariensis]SNT23997.1 AhpC/TSA family protein [Pontibacter ummariensis]